MKLSELVEFNPRFRKNSISPKQTVNFVSMSDVGKGNGVVNCANVKQYSSLKSGYSQFFQGDVIFAKITPCMENGKIAVIPKLNSHFGFGSTEFIVMRPSKQILAEYLYYFVSSQSFRQSARKQMSGNVGHMRVPLCFLRNSEISCPSIDDQTSVVESLDEAFSKIDRTISSIHDAKIKMELYRQSALKYAFERKFKQAF